MEDTEEVHQHFKAGDLYYNITSTGDLTAEVTTGCLNESSSLF